jgi:hypothetical protein
MRNEQRSELLAVTALLVALALLPAGPAVAADTSEATTVGADEQGAAAPEEKPQPRFDIYGFAMLDMGFDSGQVDPNWFDVLRPTKLPAFEDEFGKDGNFYAGVRQSRLGFKAWVPTDVGELKTIFEFELFGTGVDAGQTTFRLRHAWGELGQIGAGQTWSPFMDPDVFPNSIEYWGPNGMVFFRNVQVRWTPWQQGDSNFMIALERPGASGDQGVYSGRVELQGIKARFPLPDISAHYRMAGSWGHLQIAGMLREIKWDDTNADQYDLTGSTTGWGVNVSSNIKLDKDTLRLQVVYGEGIENYMNDAPVDIGIKNNFSSTTQPILGVALPVLGVVAFYDRTWNDRWSSTIGYSRVDITNSDGQTPAAFKTGQYALVNLLYYPTKGVMMGGELQWGDRKNFSDGWSVNDLRIQFSFKYNFSHSWGGNS